MKKNLESLKKGLYLCIVLGEILLGFCGNQKNTKQKFNNVLKKS